ncbi:MAG: NAD(P)/FAD-dependent oxidoreductase [Rhodoferax sp.]|nr:NAD(P)/FAD-dependent oxidoreductase [Rhodoferax sp.]
MPEFDVVVIGAGAAGLFCASVAGQLGVKVLLLDHYPKVAEKIRISGGGRCNFTNLHTSAANFLGDNPDFCRSALSRYTPANFVELLRRHNIPFHEKHKGQLFCDGSAQDLISMLLAECAAGSVTHWQPCAVLAIRGVGNSSGYVVDTARGAVACQSVVVATGGLSIPKIGASDFGYRVAQQFSVPVIPPRPALVPLVFEPAFWARYASMSGLSLPVTVHSGSKKQRIEFQEDLLFTHKGLSGPAGLQISSYWRANGTIKVDLSVGKSLLDDLTQAKSRSRKLLVNELSAHLPARLAEAWVGNAGVWKTQWQKPVCETTDRALAELCSQLSTWELAPAGTEGYAKAEVTAGGVDTRALSSQTMESRQKGLYFIGEVVDVTGWLGGYNFQWAWASAFACAHGLAAQRLAEQRKTL